MTQLQKARQEIAENERVNRIISVMERVTREVTESEVLKQLYERYCYNPPTSDSKGDS